MSTSMTAARKGLDSAIVAAVVVVYYPNLKLLDRLLRSISFQVNQIIIIDNTPEGSFDCAPLINRPGLSVTYQALGENKGIATAQNIGIRRALTSGCSHIILLDQDSALPRNTISKLLAAEDHLIKEGRKVAAVGPLFIEEKTGKTCRAVRHYIVRVRKIRINPADPIPFEADYIIASGSLIRASVFDAVGLMKDELFIDWVDIEWGLRARSKDYRCYIVPQAIMRHSIGDATVRLFSKNINLHNDTRHYYIVRNATYLLRFASMGWQWRSVTVLKIPQYLIFYSWCSDNKLGSLKLLFRAILDGLRGKVGQLA